MNKNDRIINEAKLEDEHDGVRKTHTVAHLGPLTKIDELSAADFDPLDFKQRYFLSNRPVVIRGALEHFDCGPAYRLWSSLDYLTQRCGSNRVHVRRNTLNNDYKVGKAYMVQEVLFETYVKELVQNTTCAQNSYLAVQNLKKAFPQISDEFRLPSIVEKLHAGPFLWIARPGHYEYTHIDPDDNLLMVFKGRKIVRLYGCNVQVMMPNKLGSKGRTIQSQINCDDLESLDDEAAKRLSSIECHYCLLKESDALYFPAFWWHQVKSPELTISVNIFFGDSGENNYTAKLLRSPDQRLSFLYWIYNIIKQNMPHASFPRILVNLRHSLKNFLFKQWHDTLSDDQLDVLYESIIGYFGLGEKLEQLGGPVSPDKRSKNPPEMRIRGLLMRPKSNDQEAASDQDD